jgi:hypothetical protein
LKTDRAFGVAVEEMPKTSIRDPAACGDSLLSLFELIAVLRVVQEEREVGEQVQTVPEHEASGTK